MTLILIALLSFVLLSSLGFLLIGNSSANQAATKRVASLSVKTAKRSASGKAAKSSGDRRKQLLGQLDELDKRQSSQRLSLSSRMLQAGLEPNLSQFWFYSSCLGGIIGLLAFIVYQNTLPLKLLVSIGSGFAAGYGLPRWVLSFMAKGRLNKFTAEFTNALDILVRGIKSGLPVNDGLRIIAKECQSPLGLNFSVWLKALAWAQRYKPALKK
jgi:tight adherence protein B